MDRIKTQKALNDALAQNPNGDFEIEATAELSISLFGSVKPILRLFGKTKISIVARDTSSPRIVAWGTNSPRIVARDTSSPSIVARDTSSPRIVARDTSSPSIVAWGTSSPRIVARDTSSPSIVAWGTSSPSIVAWGTSSPSIEARDTSSPSIEARDTSSPSIVAKGFVSLSLFGKVIATLSEKCHAMISWRGAQVTGGQQTVVNIVTAQDHFDYHGYTAEEIPLVENLDAKILEAVEMGGSVDMSSWHTCETTHCRAGWAVTLGGEAGKKIESETSSEIAGKLIYLRAYPDLPIPNFFASTDDAMDDIRSRAALARKDA